MKKFIWILAAAAAACSQPEAEQSLPQPGDRTPVRISGGIRTMSRAYDASWNENDAIGLFLTEAGTSTVVDGTENLRYVTAAGDGQFEPFGDALLLPDDAEGSYDIVAYYPYGELSDGVLTLDLSDQSEQGPIDLLSARCESIDKEHISAHLEFSHRLTKVMFNVSSPARDLSALTVRIGDQITAVRYDVLPATLAAGSAERREITLRNFALADNKHSVQVEAILLPNGADNAATDRKVEFELNGERYSAAIAATTSFEGGKKYVYEVEFSESGDVVVVGAGITDWTDAPGDESVTIPHPGISEVYLTGNINGWGQTLLDRQEDGTFVWTGGMAENDEVKFKLAEGNPYQLMSHIAGLAFDLGNPMPMCSIYYSYPNGIDNKWKAPQSGTYTIKLDVVAMTVTFTRDGDCWFAIGSATLAGWDLGKIEPLLESKERPGVFEAEMQLNAGELKFISNRDFGASAVQAPAADTPFAVGEALPIATTGGDNKWIVSDEQGGKRYRLTLDMDNRSLTAVEAE